MPRILIADDDADLRGLLKRKLTKLSYEVNEVGNGQELLTALETLSPDLIISDLQMPLLSGIEALTKLRRTDWTIPFILMTGFPGPTTHENANDLGAAYVIHKPLDLEYLGKLVKELIGD